MQDQFSRTRLLFGTDNMEILARSRVIVFGIGGVGSFAVEALVRSGLGAIDIVGDGMVSLTNVNRQLYALRSTVGQYKVDVAEARILDINPDCAVTKHRRFFSSCRMMRASGHTLVPEMSAIRNCVGSTLFPAPMQLMTGTPAAFARSIMCNLPFTVSIQSTT